MIQQGASIGRASDNTVVIRHIDVTRFHARIHCRDLEVWVTDLQSRNGTYLNNHKIYESTRIEHGDVIGFGNNDECCFRVLFCYDSALTDLPAPSIQKMVFAGVCAGMLFGGGYGAYQVLGAKPETTIKITQPLPGSTIAQTTPVMVETTNSEDIAAVIYEIDSIEITRSPEPPFMAYLDPKLIPEIAGDHQSSHVLSVCLEMKDGSRLEHLSPTQILIELPVDSQKRPAPRSESNPGPRTSPATAPNPWYTPLPLEVPARPASGPQPNLEPKSLTGSLLSRLGSPSYEPGETLEASIEMLLKSERKQRFNLSSAEQKAILTACVRRGIKPEVALILAESQSEGGIWRIPASVWKEYRFENTDSDNQLNQAVQYIKDLLNCFDEEDWIYAVASYGADISAVGAMRRNLEAYDPQKIYRKNVSRTLTSGVFPPVGGDNVRKFFINGLYLEFPHQFGIQVIPLSDQTSG